MKPHADVRWLLLLVLLVIATQSAWGQTDKVPPSSAAFDAARTGVDAFGNGIGLGTNATTINRWALEGARNAGASVQDAFGRAAIQDARGASRAMSRLSDGITATGYAMDIYRGCQNGLDGCRDAGYAVLGDAGRDALIDRAGYLFPGPVRPAYWGGVAVGNVVRGFPIGADENGRIRNAGDAVDDFTWSNIAEPIQMRITTGYWDPLSDAAINEQIDQRRAALRAQVQALRSANEQAAARQQAIDSQTAENQANLLAQQRATFDLQQMLAQQAPAPAPNGSPFAAVPRSQAPAAKPSAPQACTPARTLDPKTGCHPGHDESGHPGGCKCESGSTPH